MQRPLAAGGKGLTKRTRTGREVRFVRHVLPVALSGVALVPPPGTACGEHRSERPTAHYLVVDVVVVLLVVVEPVIPEPPGAAAVPPPDVSAPLVPPVPEAPMELVPAGAPPGVPLPLAVVSELVPVLAVPLVVPAVVDGPVGGVVLAVDGVVVVLEVVLSVLSFFVQAPSDRAAATANTAAAVLVRDVFIRETP